MFITSNMKDLFEKKLQGKERLFLHACSTQITPEDIFMFPKNAKLYEFAHI